MDPIQLINTFYPPGSRPNGILTDHSLKVAQRALAIAKNLMAHRPETSLDLGFIEKAALVHDIGIFKTCARNIGCQGSHPYICHGYLGRELLDDQGWDPAFGLVAERHTGAGITLENIQENQLPLPHRDMVPITLEEKIICCADKFYSKSPKKQNRTATMEEVIGELTALAPEHGQRFAAMAKELFITD